MALTLLGKAKREGKGPCLPRLKTREPKAMPLVQGDTAALERDGGACTNTVHAGEGSPHSTASVPERNAHTHRRLLHGCWYLMSAPTLRGPLARRGLRLSLTLGWARSLGELLVKHKVRVRETLGVQLDERRWALPVRALAECIDVSRL
jgi:hypothetical protein